MGTITKSLQRTSPRGDDESWEATIAIEEAEPGAFPHLHDSSETKVVIKNALPGVWRDQPRLYVDGHSEIVPQSDTDEASTRIGLLRTRANVEGLVLSIRQQSGMRLDGRPWSMLAFHLWDGSHVVEVVAFGSAISERYFLQPGEKIRLIGAELGWRAGLVQLRIDVRKTRIELSGRHSHPRVFEGSVSVGILCLYDCRMRTRILLDHTTDFQQVKSIHGRLVHACGITKKCVDS